MKHFFTTIRITVLFGSFLALSSVFSAAQNNCGATPPTGTCAVHTQPMQTWCAGNNPSSTCPGGKTFVGFSTTSPASGSWSKQFEGLDAASILAASHQPRAQADPNGGVGPTNSSGVGQYLEFANNFVQAYDRKTGNGILSNQRNGVAAPQTISTLFAPGGSASCANGALDGVATYDRIDDVFVIGNIFRPNSSANYYCIGVSAANGSVPANNLEGSGGNSNWNIYVYNITAALPSNPQGLHYFADYPRFGTWSDGFYISWDLEDVSNQYDIVGFEVCKLDKTNMIAGLSSHPPVCYTYIPSYVAGSGGTGNSLIHTLLPADFEGNNPVPSDTAGEYFLAQVNPSNPGSDTQCTQSVCTSDQLAFWTWSGFTSGAGPTMLTTPSSYTPGCYNPHGVYNTLCVPEPVGRFIDSVGDRLMSRLAYRFITTGSQSGEYLAVAQTVQENSTYLRTGVRYYKISAGKVPAVSFSGDIQDKTSLRFDSVPSVAMDESGNLGIAYTVTGSTAHGSTLNYDPSPFFVTVSSTGVQGTPVAILTNSGSSGQDETDSNWGEYISVSSDPNDDATFWALNEYMKGNQTANCNTTTGTGCTWATRVYTCKKGSGC
ncbi:MAG TPA: hypothetical protein VFB28_10865 [Terriglobales bacterium]|nr:hypothetical protein [Terriglobales bacterium]